MLNTLPVTEEEKQALIVFEEGVTGILLRGFGTEGSHRTLSFFFTLNGEAFTLIAQQDLVSPTRLFLE